MFPGTNCTGAPFHSLCWINSLPPFLKLLTDVSTQRLQNHRTEGKFPSLCTGSSIKCFLYCTKSFWARKGKHVLALVGPGPLTVQAEGNPRVQYYAKFLLLAQMGARTLQQQKYNLNTNRFASWMLRSRKAFLITWDTLFGLYLFPGGERYEGTNEKKG